MIEHSCSRCFFMVLCSSAAQTRVIPTIDTLWKLAGALGVNCAELISGVNVSPASGAGANELWRN